MKIWKFIKWQWSKFELWQKYWMVAMLCNITGSLTLSRYTFGTYLFYIGASMVVLGIVKLFIIDPLKDSYSNFKKEEQNLFETIKYSDKK